MTQNNFTPAAEALLAQFSRIEHSNALGRSKNYSKLLNYLITRAIAGIEQGNIDSSAPREVEIATKVFNKGESYNSADDSFVRVYISNLRKKLENYYDNEGSNETFKITIPTGGYGLSFTEVVNEVAGENIEDNDTHQCHVNSGISTKNFTKYWLLVFVIISLLSISCNLWFMQQDQRLNNADVQEHMIWRDLHRNGKPTLIVLGDLYSYIEKDPSLNHQDRIVRSTYINNKEDLIRFIEQNPSKNSFIRESEVKLLFKGTSFALKELMSLFPDKNDVEIKLNSQLTPNDFKKFNLIYIGLNKSLGGFHGYFKGSNFMLKNWHRVLQQKNPDKKFPVIGDLKNSYTDYGIFAKYNGVNDNVVYLFTGFSDAAIMLMAKDLTDLNKLNALQEKFQAKQANKESNFEALFEVNSFNRTDLNAKILYTGAVDNKAILAAPKE